jgi:preprotein translocase subunit Sec63
MWKLFAIIILATATCLAFANVSDKKNQIKGFDPYELLGVDSSTPIEKIRKAYR